MSDAQDSGAANNEAADSQNVDAAAQAAADAQGKANEGGNAVEGQGKEGAQNAEGKDDSGKAAESDAPVDYTFEMPEGIELDQARADEFKEIAKSLKLSQEDASKLAQLAIKREQQLVEQHVNQVKEWGDTIAKDKVLGKPENQAVAKKAIDTFGTPELKQYLQASGLGNHPELVRLAYNVGKAISEDKFIAGRDGGNVVPKNPEDVLYGSN